MVAFPRADSLSNLSYLNGFSTPVKTVDAASGAVGAIITFDASDGTVTTVLPYTANRAAGTTLVPIRDGSALVYRAAFLGVWDEAGTNRAPHGAFEVRLDAHTGKILECRQGASQ